MSRVLGALKKDEGVCCCEYCDCVFAYKNDDIKKEKKSEVDYFGVETWEYYNEKYKPLRNKLASEFKKLCPKPI